MSDAQPFDRRAVRRWRARAARRGGDHDFLFREAADRLTERLGDVRRRFDRVLVLGGRGGMVTAPEGATLFVTADSAVEFIRAGHDTRVVLDEERLPFAPASFDLVLGVPSLHWVNDLPGALVQIRRALAPDGLFLAALFGGDTLADLRACLIEAEAAVTGGASPRVAPFVDVPDAGQLLQRAGFALPVVDRETITVDYPDALALMRELRAMGESNALAARSRGLTAPAVLARAAALYQERCGTDGERVSARFDLVFLTAWAPGPDQPKPLRPGSATGRLADALDSAERGLGERTDE